MILIELALVVVAALFACFTWPWIFDWLGDSNPFRNTAWVKRMNPPWLLPAVYVLALMVVEFRFGWIFVALIGAVILLSITISDMLEGLGSWNIGAWQNTRAIGITTIALAIAIPLVMRPFFEPILLAGLAFYLWRYEQGFVRSLMALVRPTKRETKSA